MKYFKRYITISLWLLLQAASFSYANEEYETGYSSYDQEFRNDVEYSSMDRQEPDDEADVEIPFNSLDREHVGHGKEEPYNMNKIRAKISEENLEEAFSGCRRRQRERDELEMRLVRQGRVIRPQDRITDISLNRDKDTDPDLYAREREQLAFDGATRMLVQQHNLTDEDIELGLPRYPISRGTSRRHKDSCERMIDPHTCFQNSKYRTYDGSCNNLDNPTYGTAGRCRIRMLPPNYEGSSEFRMSVTGRPLPEPRQLSLNLHNHINRPSSNLTPLYTFFGQLLDHDFAATPASVTVDNLPIQCCPEQNETHPQCRPIRIRPDDPFYSQFGTRCINFVRSVICQTCRMGPRQFVSAITSFLDASFVYGNEENRTRELRTLDGTGQMQMQKNRFGPLLPGTPNPRDDRCSFVETNELCFDAGDVRVNQNTLLASLQTVFVREHNRVATQLKLINPHWDEERLFQETRRIVDGELQAITYKEYLPITLGPERMKYFQLEVSATGSSVYNPTIDATLILEFSTAAFRFGHTLINSVMSESPLNSTNGYRLLRNEFFQPFDLYNGVLGPLMSGASRSPAQSYDQNLVPDINRYLYRVRGSRPGLDLASININRGRDHGLPTYVEMVEWCSDDRIILRDFRDIEKWRLMRPRQVDALRRNYRDVADVDLWPGMLMERPLRGAVVGPTAACIIGLQFHHMKFGDRFYFEHRREAGSFTHQQRMELRRATLTRIVCLNSDAIVMTSNAMLARSETNPIVNCRSIGGIDLSYWRDDFEERSPMRSPSEESDEDEK